MENLKDLKLYTHKLNDSEVFIEKILRVSDKIFQSDCLVINDHPFYSDFNASVGFINPLYLLECARQIETYLSHKEFGIYLDSKFLLRKWSIKYYITPLEDSDKIKANIFTNKKATRNEFNIIFTKDDRIISEIKINVTYVSSACYKLIRKHIQTSPQKIELKENLNPECVCYNSPDNVILTRLHDTVPYISTIININKNNKSFNDHEQDHITGMNLTEAAKQLCYYYLSKMHENIGYFIPTEIDGDFFNYVEINMPAIVKIQKVSLYNDIYFFNVNVLQNESIMASLKLKIERNIWKN
ncbi:AfsA-related hotdog domain-containing protein [Bisgaard Taxon 10/6]|uniref:AfsA-related hotdog domain-containing protein n=1 Tax=Exercitatus varius TaxID=67857 RepID=UPI00294AD881|nr:AfsA-related hotdog domain-containing protein [Exercitatus varius]MDG2918311.1 AfsA-related hotdog domain-containing protein [Exercitatus varius]MDG2961521.1 AfsA-related hotdog domain-containing protein [Exercitatus varius]